MRQPMLHSNDGASHYGIMLRDYYRVKMFYSRVRYCLCKWCGMFHRRCNTENCGWDSHSPFQLRLPSLVEWERVSSTISKSLYKSGLTNSRRVIQWMRMEPERESKSLSPCEVRKNHVNEYY